MDYNRRSLSRSPSQETLSSMIRLEPQPIADTEKDLPPLAEDHEPRSRSRSVPGHARTTTSLGLSGSSRGSVYYLTRIQRYSTYAFSAFAAIHLANTSLIPLITRSVAAAESYLLLAREIYQTPLTEPLLVALPIAAHIAAGLALRAVRRAQHLDRYGGGTTRARPPLHARALSGYGLAAALGAHVAVTRWLPRRGDGGGGGTVGLAFVAHGFARRPAAAAAAYAALLGLACGHMVWGWAAWCGLAPRAGWAAAAAGLRRGGGANDPGEDAGSRTRRRRVWLWVNGTAVVASVVWAAGGLGVVARGGRVEGWVGKLYDEMYAAVGL